MTLRLGFRLACAAWIALAAAQQATPGPDRAVSVGNCQDANGCPQSSGGRQSNNSAPFLTASLSCIVAFCLLMFALKVFMNRRRRRNGQDWPGSEMGGGMFRPGGMMNRIMRWRPPTLAKQKQAEELVALLNNDDSGTVWVACKPRKNAQYDEPMKMTSIHWFRASDDTNGEPMRNYVIGAPPFGADEGSVELDSEGNVHAIVEIPEAMDSVSGVTIPLGEACCICFENKSDVRLFPCGHSVSCRLCFMRTLLTWTQEYKPNCAVCRKTITTFTIHDSVSGPVGGSYPASRDSSWHSRRHAPAPRDASRHDASRHSHSSALNHPARHGMQQPFTLFAGPPSNPQQDAGNRSVRSAMETVADRLQQLVPSGQTAIDPPSSSAHNEEVTVELGFSGADDSSHTSVPSFVQGGSQTLRVGPRAPVVVL